jgi:hypothetical protein
LLNVAGRETAAFGSYLRKRGSRKIREQCLAESRFGNGVKDVDR